VRETLEGRGGREGGKEGRKRTTHLVWNDGPRAGLRLPRHTNHSPPHHDHPHDRTIKKFHVMVLVCKVGGGVERGGRRHASHKRRREEEEEEAVDRAGRWMMGPGKKYY